MARMCSFATIFIAVLCMLVLEINGELCKRMYFGHGREAEMPFVQLEGVYIFQNNDSTGHPLLKHEQRNYYFEYHLHTNQMFFSNTSNGFYEGKKSFMGLMASMKNRFSLSNWEDFISDNIYPFQSFITEWTYYNGLSIHDGNSLGKWQAYLKCVPEDVFKCSSGQLFFNTTITSNGQQTLHNHTTDYFSLIFGVYINFRQVYKHNKQKNWFLFYQNNAWTVGLDYNNASGYLRAVGNPLRPEFLQTNWEYWNGKWVYFKQPVGLKCRGLNRKHNNGSVITCADSNPCQNNGRCMDISLTNETVCICPDAFKGPTCSTPVRSCRGAYKPSVSVLSYHVNGRKVNDFATVFCKTESKELRVVYQSQEDGEPSLIEEQEKEEQEEEEQPGPVRPTQGEERRPGPIGRSQEDKHLGPVGPVREDVHLGPAGPVREDVHLGPVGPVREDVHLGPVGPAREDVHLGPVGPAREEGHIVHRDTEATKEYLATVNGLDHCYYLLSVFYRS
eukprot:gene13879-15327_t